MKTKLELDSPVCDMGRSVRLKRYSEGLGLIFPEPFFKNFQLHDVVVLPCFWCELLKSNVRTRYKESLIHRRHTLYLAVALLKSGPGDHELLYNICSQVLF
jgi:hypothetical protein